MEVGTHFQQKTCRVQNGWMAGWLDVLGSPRWKKSSCHGMCFKANQVVPYLSCGKSLPCSLPAFGIVCSVLSAYHVGLSGMIDSKSRHFRGDPHLGALLGPLHMVHGFQIAV